MSMRQWLRLMPVLAFAQHVMVRGLIERDRGVTRWPMTEG